MSREDRGSSGLLAPGLLRWRPKAWRWLLAGMVAIVAPKCLLCAVGYGAVLTGVGLAGPELCGGTADQVIPLGVGFVAIGVVAAMIGVATVLVAKVVGRRAQQSARS